MAKHLKIEDLTKGNIWTFSESEINQILQDGKKHEGFSDVEAHYMNIIHSAFDTVQLDRNDEERVRQLEAEHYEIFSTPSEGENNAIALRKHSINKITDLTLENIAHLLPEEVLALIKANMGTGWQGLSLAIQDIIESAFFVDCTVMPAYALHRKGGIIERRKNDGYEVLELERGTWIEAIFLKSKPKIEKIRFSSASELDRRDQEDDEDFDDELDDEDDDLNDDDVTPNDDEDDDEMMDEENPDIEEIDVIDDVELDD